MDWLHATLESYCSVKAAVVRPGPDRTRHIQAVLFAIYCGCRTSTTGSGDADGPRQYSFMASEVRAAVAHRMGRRLTGRRTKEPLDAQHVRDSLRSPADDSPTVTSIGKNVQAISRLGSGSGCGVVFFEQHRSSWDMQQMLHSGRRQRQYVSTTLTCSLQGLC